MVKKGEEENSIPETKGSIPTIGYLYPAAGHWLLAGKRAGFKTQWVLEVGKPEIDTITLNFPGIKIFSDPGTELKKVDVIVGSPPCKGFSTGHGTIKDLDCNQEILSFAEIATGLKPHTIVMENVPGLVKRFEGKYFKQLLATLTSAGYKIQWGLFNARDYGGFQSRRRVLVLASLGQLPHFPSITPARPVQDVIGDLVGKSPDFHPDHYGLPFPIPIFMNFQRLTANKPSYTVSGYAYRIQHYSLKRALTLLELKRIMGLPDDWRLPGEEFTLKCRMIGEGVDINLLERVFYWIRQSLEKCGVYHG